MAENNVLNLAFPVPVDKGGVGVATLTEHAILKGNGTSAVDGVNLLDGQLLVGSTGLAPSAATLTAGANVTITEAAGSITIATAAGGIDWSEETTAARALTVNTGTIANNAAQVACTLPTTVAVGAVFEIAGAGVGGWRVEQNALQTIQFGDTASTAGVTGYIESTLQFDAVKLVCITADTDFVVVSAVGNLDVV